MSLGAFSGLTSDRRTMPETAGKV